MTFDLNRHGRYGEVCPECGLTGLRSVLLRHGCPSATGGLREQVADALRPTFGTDALYAAKVAIEAVGPVVDALTAERDRLAEACASTERIAGWRAGALNKAEAEVAALRALMKRALDDKRIRHDHAYPMEVGPHHCAGCDMHDEFRAALGVTDG